MATLGEIVAANAIATGERRADDEAKRAKQARVREQWRVRDARRQERNREKAIREAAAQAERIDAEAARAERIGERLAPTVLRNPICTPERVTVDGEVIAGVMLVGPRVQIIDGRPVRTSAMGSESDPIAKLARESKSVTERHFRAFRRLQQDWGDVGSGLGVGAVDYMRSGGGSGDGEGGHLAMRAQIDARNSLEGAMAHLGAFAPMVARVVLDCIPLSVWYEEAKRVTTPAAPADPVAWVAVAGTRLANFYWPPKLDGASGPVLLTFGPAREAYVMTMDEQSAA